MKSLKQIQTLSKIGKVLSKIVFIGSIVGCCGCIAGLLGMIFGNAAAMKIGGVTLHGLMANNGVNLKSVIPVLAGSCIVFAGGAVLAKFAERYFKNELCSGTPFTLDGANELMRLGILKISISLGCAIAAHIVQEIIAGLLNVTADAAGEFSYSSEGAVAMGIVFMIVSVLCRYGAEIMQTDSDVEN